MTLHTSFIVPLTPPSSSLFLSKANSTSTGELDKLVSPAALTPESEEEQLLPPQRVSTFRPRPYSMADSNKVPNQTYARLMLICVPMTCHECYMCFGAADHLGLGLSTALPNQVTDCRCGLVFVWVNNAGLLLHVMSINNMESILSNV